MKEKWTKDIRERMVNYERPVSEGLWERIEGEMQARGTMQKPHKYLPIVGLWTKRVAGVAAMLAVVLVVGKQFFVESERPKSVSKNDGVTQPLPVKIGNALNHLAQANDVVKTKALERKPALPIITRSAEIAPPVVDNEVAESVADTASTPLLAVQNETKRPQHLATQHKQIANKAVQSRQPLSVEHRASRFATSVFTTGGMASSLNQKSIGMANVAGTGPDNTDWEDSPLLGIATYNQGREVKTTIKHHLPIRTGVMVSYAINKRFAVESGVTYTLLNSDLHDGSESHYVSRKQSLHYVGVPINVKYKFYSHKGLSLYASAGALTEKCISGKRKTTYVLDKEAQLAEQDEVRPRGLQFSVNASAGAQYNVASTVALFAEPGMSYYFDDGSDVRTIYKEKPLNLNVNLGLRFTLGK